MWLVTIDGERVFDWTGYYGSKLIAHNHPGLFEPNYSGHYRSPRTTRSRTPTF